MLIIDSCRKRFFNEISARIFLHFLGKQIRRVYSFFLSFIQTYILFRCHFIFIFCLRYIFCLHPMSSQLSHDSSVSRRDMEGDVLQVNFSFRKTMDEWIIMRRFRRNINLVCQRYFDTLMHVFSSRKTSH